MLTEKEIKRIKDELDSCKNPLYFYDSDPDGLCSFLLFYRYKHEGHGVIVKSNPFLNEKFLHKVEEYQPDKIFVLDIANVDQDFIDKVKVPVIWIDHHTPLERSKVLYFNPRKHSQNHVPTSQMCYQVVKQDLWIAMIGIVSDWFIPPYLDLFALDYPDLMPQDISAPDAVLYGSKLGELARMLSFLLKGKTEDVKKSINILTRIKDPYELLQHTTPASHYLFKRYDPIMADYQRLLAEVLEKKFGRMLVFTYEGRMTFSADLANELIHRFPDKMVIVGRIKSGEVKCSFRGKMNISEMLAKALVGIHGYGGGHEHACGANIKQEDFDRFVENIKQELS